MLDFFQSHYSFAALNSAATDSTVTPHSAIQHLRSAELQSLLFHPGAILPQTPDFHYVGPNGRHYTNFVRVGMALRSSEALNAYTFWLLPYLRGSNIVLLDTWTIMALGLNCQSYPARMGIIEPGFAVATVEALREYGDRHWQEFQRLLGNLTLDPSFTPRPLLIISTSGSGRTAGRLFELCERAGIEERHAVSLYGPGNVRDAGHAILCPLDESFRGSPADQCHECKCKSEPIAIDPSTFLLALAAYHPTRIRRKEDAADAREFLQRYRGHPYLTVHRDFEPGGRHHMIYVDVSALLRVPAFVNRVGVQVENLRGRIDHVLSPSHPAAQDLAKFVSDRLGVKVTHCDEHALARLPPDELGAIRRAAHLLIVDDVTITGSRLRGYRNVMVGQGIDGPEVTFLVGVARPPDGDALQATLDLAHERERFLVGDTLLLPHWGETECPWCWELEGMSDAHSLSHEDGVVNDRYMQLADRRRGISSGLFLGGAFAAPGGSFRLGKGSVFGTALSDVELFVSVASTLQALRSKGTLSNHTRSPVARYLDPDLTFNRYYEGFIAAAIMRAARIHDLRSTRSDAKLALKVTEWLTGSEAYGRVRAEILLAVAMGKLPIVDELVERDAGVYPDGALGEHLRSLIARQASAPFARATRR